MFLKRITPYIFLLLTSFLLKDASYAEPPSLDIQTTQDFDVRRSDQKEGPDISLRRLEVETKLTLNRHIKAVLEVELRHHFLKNGLKVSNKTSLKKALEGAYFIFTPHPNSRKALVAKVIFGKHRIAFGNYKKKNLLGGKPYLFISKKEEVIGVTVVLRTQKFFDQISMSFYENGSGDFEIAEHYGLSVKAIRRIRKNLLFSISSLWHQGDSSQSDEFRLELGVLYKNKNLGLQLYARGTLMHEHPKYGKALALITGITQQLSNRWGRLGTEFSFVEDYAYLISASWLITPFDDLNFSIGPEIVYTHFHKPIKVGSNITQDDWTFGFRARLKIKKHFSKKKKLWQNP